MERLLELSQTALREMRSLLFELRSSEEMQDMELPVTLTGLERIRHYGLLGAIRLLAGDFSEEGIMVNVEVDEGGIRLFDTETGSKSGKEPMIEESTYRIVQESLNNAVKHARAHHVSIRIKCDSEKLDFSVIDDGQGFTNQSIKNEALKGSGLGMKTMQERAEALGGTLNVSSAPGRGTAVEVTIPLKELRI